MAELKDISLDYFFRKGTPIFGRQIKKTSALQEINALFNKGELTAIVGPSGCGKTSLIKIMAGLIKPSEGQVYIDGNQLTGVRRETSVIFQDLGLLPWKTVMANAELPLLIKNREQGAVDKREKVKSLLAEFGLIDFAGYYPQQLSGGMKQRLAIVRALAAEPELLLMDEPFSSLDAQTREAAQDFLLSVQQKHRLTIIMVTHSIEEAVYLADSIYVMNGVNPGTMTEKIKILRTRSSRACTSLGDTSLGDTSHSDTSHGDTSLSDTSLGDTSLSDTSLGDTSLGDTSLGNTFSLAIDQYHNFRNSEHFPEYCELIRKRLVPGTPSSGTLPSAAFMPDKRGIT